jgi:hypothetical protein
MHGGAPGSGAPRGNNREALAEREQIRDLLRQTRKLMLQIK